MDFAAGSDFVKGINRYDQQAKQKEIFMLSGVSSFPVLTAAVVRRLSKNMDSIISIKGGIAPSPFAGVGLNVIKAIAAYAGQKVVLKRNGIISYGYGLTEVMRYTISPPGRMPLHNIRFSLVDVPDLQLLPDIWPQLDSIWMGAGPVPEVLHRMLNALSWLVRWRLLPSLTPFARLFFHAINILRWGEHRGGMFVEITGIQNGNRQTSSWHLLAEGKDGPYIPCMAIQAIVLQILTGDFPIAGARAASKDLELEDYEALFMERSIYTGERHHREYVEPYILQAILGSAWAQLPSPVQKLHSVDTFLQASGVATVVRGTNWLASLVAKVFRFPGPGQNISIKVDIERSSKGEKWTRTFGTRSFTSHLSLGKGLSERLMVERFGPFSFGLALVQDAGKLRFVVRRWSLWKFSLPNFLVPFGDSYEFENNGRFNFHVEIGLPLIGLVVRYSGWLAFSE